MDTGVVSGLTQATGKIAAKGLAPLPLIIVVEVNAGIHLAALEVVQTVLAGCLRSTIICQKTVAQTTAELTAVIIVKTAMFITSKFVFPKDVQIILKSAMNIPILMNKKFKIVVILAVQKGNARKRDGVGHGQMMIVRIVIIVLGLNVDLHQGLSRAFVEQLQVVIVVSKKEHIRHAWIRWAPSPALGPVLVRFLATVLFLESVL